MAGLRHEIESRPILLSDTQVEAIFEQNIQQLQSQNPEFAQKLAFCLDLLRDAKANGVPAAFARLAQVLEPAETDGDLPADFVERAVWGLKGGDQDKLDLFNQLSELIQQVPPPERKLVEQVQRALFSADPGAMLAELEEAQLAIWRQIVERL